MSAADMLEDGFPHGTREGYEKGCRGSHCPAVADGHLSCAQARTRYQSDYAYKKRVDAGMTPAQLAEVDEREAAEQRARLAAARANREAVRSAPEPEPVNEPSDDHEPVVDDGIALEKHGTTSGYHAGCRLKEMCPGVESVGRSCTDAATEYQRQYAARKRAEKEGRERAVEPVKVPVPSEAAEPKIARDESAEPPYVVALRGELAVASKRAENAVNDVAVLEGKLDDALARNRELTDRVASLELELDVAKSANRKAAAVEQETTTEVDWPAAAEKSMEALDRMASSFSLMRVGEGVIVNVDGEAPSQVHFAFGEDGALSGVSVQSGK